MMTEAELSKIQSKSQDITQGLPQLTPKARELERLAQDLPGTVLATTAEGWMVNYPVQLLPKSPKAKRTKKPSAPQPPQKRKRSSGTYIVLTAGNVAQEGGGILPVLVPGHEFSSRVQADKYALEYARENPGAVVIVHRILGQVSVQTVSTVKLVRS